MRELLSICTIVRFLAFEKLSNSVVTQQFTTRRRAAFAMTQCTQSGFDFKAHFSRILCAFDAQSVPTVLAAVAANGPAAELVDAICELFSGRPEQDRVNTPLWR